MGKFLIRDSNELDYQTIVDINDVEVQYTSPMDVKRLRYLDQLSAYHRVAVVEGNIAAMGRNCSYQNENYDWFSSLYPGFLYIDRIVVDAKYAGLKIGTMLYRDIFHYAVLIAFLSSPVSTILYRQMNRLAYFTRNSGLKKSVCNGYVTVLRRCHFKLQRYSKSLHAAKLLNSLILSTRDIHRRWRNCRKSKTLDSLSQPIVSYHRPLTTR